MSDLLKLIQAYLAQANIRGIDPENPIPFIIRSPDGQPNEGKKFIVQVGYTEPTFSQLPYSVLWICFDSESDRHAKLFRRISHHPSPLTSDLDYTWMEVTEYGQVFEKEQFYVPVADLDLVGGSDQVDPILVASTSSLGTVLTKEDSVEPRAVLTTDERLSDSRDVLPHTHEDKPSSMLKVFGYEVPLLDDEDQPVIIEGQPLMEVKLAYVRIDDAFPSEDSELLFIKEKDPQLENVWIGEWRQARDSDILLTGPKVVSARIISPAASYEDNKDYDFNWEVTYDDSNVIMLDPNWEVTDNVLLITLDENGVLSIPDLQEDTQVTVTASATYDGQEFSDSVVVDISDNYTPVVPQRIEITGPTTVKELEEGQYVVKLHMSDGSSSEITPDSFVSDNDTAAIIDVNGKLTAYDVEENQPVTLTANYSIDGVDLSTTFDMTVVVEVLDWELEIRGASSMDELTAETFEVYSVDEKGGEASITPNVFEISNGQAHANLVGMQLTANDINGVQTVTLRAEHTVDSVTKSATKSVSIRDLTVYPESLELTFPSQMDEQTSLDMILNVVYTDGSKVLLGNPDQVTFSKTNVLTYVSPLTITSESITSNTTVDITVNHNEDGIDLEATQRVTVQNSISESTGIKPQQNPLYVNEMGGGVSLYMYLDNDDNTTTQIEDLENVTLTPSSDLIEIEQQSSGNGWIITSAKSVIGNQSVTIKVDYLHEGKTLTTDVDVNVVDTIQAVTGIEISGSESVNEGGVVDLQVKLLKDDGTKETLSSVAPVVVSQSPNILTISKSGQDISCKAPTNLTEDTPVTITVEHDVDGQTFTDDHVITVSNTTKSVTSWTIEGADEVIIGRKFVDQYSYSLSMSFDDGTSSTDVKALEWRIQDNPNVIISNQDTGRIDFTIKESELSSPQTFTIEARAYINGSSEWSSKQVSIAAQDRSEIGFRLFGDTELNENVVSTEYVGQAHFNSNWVDNCDLKTLTIVGESHGAVIVDGNKLDTSKVVGEQTITIQGVFDWAELTDLTETLEVTLKDNLIDFKSAEFKSSNNEFKEGEAVNPTDVTVTMTNDTTRNAVAKSVTIVSGAEFVDVSGSGSSTSFTVKSGLPSDGVVTWNGVVTVDGEDHNVTEATVTVKKVEAFVMKTAFAMAEALQPTRLVDGVDELLPLMEADHYYFEITDEMAAKAKYGGPEYTGDIDLALNSAPDGTYPTHTEPAPYSTTHIISKVEWGRPVFVNILGLVETVHYEGARTYKPRDTLETLPDTPPAPWEVPLDAKYETHQDQISTFETGVISYIPYVDPNTGEKYTMTRGGWPIAPTVGQPVVLFLRFVDWEVPFPD